MTFAITIGSYRLPQFVELCVRRCRRIFDDGVPILISDDLSDLSPTIKDLANRLDCGYVVGDGRQSHFGGDMQAVLNAIAWADNADIAIKISQRFIPVLYDFRLALEKAFATPSTMVAVPGQIQARQISRPQAAFYGRFGILTDVIAIRRGAISTKELLDTYIQRVRTPKARSDCFVETTFGWLLANKFQGAHAIVPEWTNHQPFKPKVYLRKSQSNALEYEQVAAMEGMTGNWDLREWIQIERHGYLARPA